MGDWVIDGNIIRRSGGGPFSSRIQEYRWDGSKWSLYSRSEDRAPGMMVTVCEPDVFEDEHPITERESGDLLEACGLTDEDLPIAEVARTSPTRLAALASRRRCRHVHASMDKSLLTIVRLLKRALPLKELPRTGWIMEGAARSDSDSVAAHSYCVALVGYLTARELDQMQEFTPIGWERVLAMATLHDLAESVTGELATGFKRRIAATPGRETLVDDLEHEALEYLLKDLHQGAELTELLRLYDECQTKEAKIVKFADIVDAFAHAKVHLKRTFDRYLDLSEEKLKMGSPDKDSGVGNYLAGWLRQLREEWDNIDPLPIS